MVHLARRNETRSGVTILPSLDPGHANTISPSDRLSCCRVMNPSLRVKFERAGDWSVSPPGSLSSFAIGPG